MIEGLHILAGATAVAVSVFSITQDKSRSIQPKLLAMVCILTLLAIVSGIGLVLVGGSFARFCIIGTLMVGLCIFSAHRVIKTQEIRIEL